MSGKKLDAHGFTLIELMVVLVILGVLASLIVPRIMSRPEEARRIKARVDIQSLETALKLYNLDNGDYPTTEQGLQALVEPPTTGTLPKNWREGGCAARHAGLDQHGQAAQGLLRVCASFSGNIDAILNSRRPRAIQLAPGT